MEGITIVVSPLLALMHDQVVALKANGISAVMLSSMQEREESQQIEAQLKAGEVKLLYVAPERLTNSYFLSLLHQLPINFFVIDEAHCVSEWGHEFRENYRRLSLLKEQFPATPITAFTATATHAVEQDIATNLGLQDTKGSRVSSTPSPANPPSRSVAFSSPKGSKPSPTTQDSPPKRRTVPTQTSSQTRYRSSSLLSPLGWG